MRTAEDQMTELRELEAMYPPPTGDDWVADREWLAGENAKRNWNLWDTNVAVLDKTIIGCGPDCIELQIRLAKEYKVHPDRLVIVYFGDYERPWLDYS